MCGWHQIPRPQAKALSTTAGQKPWKASCCVLFQMCVLRKLLAVQQVLPLTARIWLGREAKFLVQNERFLVLPIHGPGVRQDFGRKGLRVVRSSSRQQLPAIDCMRTLERTSSQICASPTRLLANEGHGLDVRAKSFHAALSLDQSMCAVSDDVVFR